MRYIDKNTSNADGNRITDEYLDSECKMTDPFITKCTLQRYCELYI